MSDPQLAASLAPPTQDRKAKAADDPAGIALAPVLFASPPAAIDLGEQVVGSDGWFEIGPILAVAGAQITGTLHSWCEPIAASAATAKIASELGVTDRAVSAASLTELAGEPRREVSSTGANAALRVRFRPVRAGETYATFHYVLRTHDGAVSQGAVMIRARAREIDAAPAQAPELSGPSTTIEDTTAGMPPQQDLEGAVMKAQTAAKAIAGAQLEGVVTAQAESEAYTRELPPGPWWAPLAEIAITMGIAGVAGIVAKLLAPKIGDLLQISEEARKSSARILFATDALKEGLKATGKKAAKGSEASADAERPALREEGARPRSTNPRIAFWARQRDMLKNVSASNADLITDMRARLLPVYQTSPAAAIATMERVKDGLDASHVAVSDHQALQSSIQWVSGIARSAHGTEVVATPDRGTQSATDMSKVRDLDGPLPDPDEGPAHRYQAIVDESKRRFRLDGVLQLEVRIPKGATASSPDLVVVWAELNGVSQEIADRITWHELRELPLPIRIEVVGGARAIITRDELGRVRVTGRLPLENTMPAGPPREVDNIRAAMQLVDTVLAKDLASWLGKDAIETDDATKRGG